MKPRYPQDYEFRIVWLDDKDQVVSRSMVWYRKLEEARAGAKSLATEHLHYKYERRLAEGGK